MNTKIVIAFLLACLVGGSWHGPVHGQGSGQLLAQKRWQTGNKHVYAYVSLPDSTWEEAQSDLDNLLPGYHLATITSQEEHNFVIGLLDEVPSFSQGWLGGFQNPPGEVNPAAGWTWVTGELWDYTNWYFGEPNDGGGCLCENHLAIDFHRGWNDEGSAITSVTGYFAESYDPFFWDGFESVPQALCGACVTDNDCLGPTDKCLTVDGVNVCGQDCSEGNPHSTPAGECQPGYVCMDDLQGGLQCVPTTGSCTCTPENQSETRVCSVSSSYGTCEGLQTCAAEGWSSCSADVAVQEVCDGIDNDCNGTVDDNLAPVLCPLQEGVCLGSVTPCRGAEGYRYDCGVAEYGFDYEATEISCDGKDNDCDGEIDESCNETPVANADAASVDEGGAVNIDLAANDKDAEEALDLSSIAVVSIATNGQVLVNGDGTVDYTHDGSETISDGFTYRISDDHGAVSNTAPVILTINPVNDTPVANADEASVDKGGTVNIDLAANDTDAEEVLDLSSIVIVSDPTNGLVDVNGDGTVGYTHDGSETISDEFTYRISDDYGAVSNTAPVSLTIDPIEDPACEIDGVWAAEARDCTLEDCSGGDGRHRSWDGRIWCRALITQEFDDWTIEVPPAVTTFDFWVDWGAWDMNDCGDGISAVSIPACGLSQPVLRDGEEQHLTCEVAGLSSLTIEKEKDLCEYIIIGDPHFRNLHGVGLVINEVDYDQPGADDKEFIELFNSSAHAISLSGISLVLITGASNSEYARFDLPIGGLLAPGAFLTIGSAEAFAPALPDILFPPEFITIHNGGPDGIALVNVETGRLLDALSYEGEITAAMIDETGTVSLAEGTALTVEDSNSVTGSLARIPNGNDTNNADADWAFSTTVTPGYENQ